MSDNDDYRVKKLPVPAKGHLPAAPREHPEQPTGGMLTGWQRVRELNRQTRIDRAGKERYDAHRDKLDSIAGAAEAYIRLTRTLGKVEDVPATLADDQAGRDAGRQIAAYQRQAALVRAKNTVRLTEAEDQLALDRLENDRQKEAQRQRWREELSPLSMQAVAARKRAEEAEVQELYGGREAGRGIRNSEQAGQTPYCAAIAAIDQQITEATGKGEPAEHLWKMKRELAEQRDKWRGQPRPQGENERPA